jgi:transposase
MARGLSRRNAAARLGVNESILRGWQEALPVSNGVDNYEQSALTEFSAEQSVLCQVLKYSNQPSIRSIASRALYNSGLSKTTISNITGVDTGSVEKLMKAKYKL